MRLDQAHGTEYDGHERQEEMMLNITASSAADAMIQMCDALTMGDVPVVSPRRLATRELTDVTIMLDNTFDVLMYDIGREGYHPVIGIIEALLLIGGVSDPDLLKTACPGFVRYQDGGALHGAYGPRVRPQIPGVIELLSRDPDTRQAVISIWDPLHDLQYPAPYDVPCTISLTFRIRDGRLTLKTHMRSNDVWRGWPYDVIQFTTLQNTMANTLGLPSGSYVHHVDSLHMYETDVPLAAMVACNDTATTQLIRLFGLSSVNGASYHDDDNDDDDDDPVITWSDMRDNAMSLLYGDRWHRSGTEKFFFEKLSAVRNTP